MRQTPRLTEHNGQQRATHRLTVKAPLRQECVAGAIAASFPARCVCRPALERDDAGASKKAIENIGIGDVVWACDETTEERVKRPVKRLFRHASRSIVAVSLIGDTGDREVIEATAEHPFWVVGKGWTAASALLAGDVLKSIHASSVWLVAGSSFSRAADVFNFEVESFHNYFVGRAGILVHNASVLPGEGGKHVVLDFDGPFINGGEGRKSMHSWSADHPQDTPYPVEKFAAAMHEDAKEFLRRLGKDSRVKSISMSSTYAHYTNGFTDDVFIGVLEHIGAGEAAQKIHPDWRVIGEISNDKKEASSAAARVPTLFAWARKNGIEIEDLAIVDDDLSFTKKEAHPEIVERSLVIPGRNIRKGLSLTDWERFSELLGPQATPEEVSHAGHEALLANDEADGPTTGRRQDVADRLMEGDAPRQATSGARYVELPTAHGRATGQHLATRVAEYAAIHDPKFVVGMSSAIDNSVSAFTTRLKEQGAVSPSEVWNVLRHIGIARMKIQIQKVELDAAGMPLNWDDYTMAHEYGRPLPSNSSNAMWDYIKADNRHSSYMERAAAWAEAHGSSSREVSFSVGTRRTTVPLSTVVGSYAQGFIVIHPTFDQSRTLSGRATGLFSEVLSTPNLTEQQGVARIAEANFLMMHGTPFMLGSPSCVESLTDAVLRSRFGKTLPQKAVGVEPFWEAIFSPPGESGLKDFVGRYRQFYEDL